MELTLISRVPVCVDGYCWRNNASDKLVLTANSDVFEHRDILAKESALFLQFAELEPTPEAIVAFASRFGHLRDVDQEEGLVIKGCQLPTWQRMIEAMKYAVTLWQALANPRTKENQQSLQEYVRWKVGRVIYQGLHMSPRIFRLAPDLPETGFRQGDLVGPGQAFLDHLLVSSAQFQLDMDVRRSTKGALEIYAVANEFLYAAWAQFAFAVAQSKNYVRCKRCRRPFELAPSVNRKDKMFCSMNCRTLAYRKRRSEAVRMRKGGKSMREIAAGLDTTMETVKGWLNAKDVL